MYDYYKNTYEAHERMKQREREAQAERTWRQARARRQRRRRTQLARALEHLTHPRQRARLRTGA